MKNPVNEVATVVDEKACHHTYFFFSPYLVNLKMTDEERRHLPGVFKCGLNCGFWMCFDPVKFPNGPSYTTMPRNRTAEGAEPRSSHTLSTYRS